MRASKSRGVSSILVRPALWFCACNLLAAGLAAQCSNPTQVPNGTYTSGDHSATDNNALSAANFVLSGGASATFVAGNCIQLLPNFHANAIGATVSTTFHAWVETAPAAVSVSPASSTGLSQPFTWTVSSPSGYSNLSDVYALFNTSISGANACYIHYNRASNLLSVADNSGSNWSTGIVPGSSGTTGTFSPNCTVNGSGSSVSLSGTQLALTASVTFQSTFSGTKNRYLIAYDNEGLNTTWQQFGTWTVANSGSFTPIRISAGGPYTDSVGQVWSADYGYVQGDTYTTTAPLTGTTDPALYATERYNAPSLTYQFSVPNGSYTVTLKFAEIYDSAAGQRYMNITLNGTTVVTGLDVWTASGAKNRAYDLSYPVTVTNGQLTITLACTSSNNSGEVNAIQIVAGTTQQQYSLTTAVNPSGGGTISPSCPGGCSYASGSQVTLTATPSSGYQFSSFTGVDSSSGSTGYVTMNANRGVTANFTATASPSFSLAATATSSTSVTPGGSATYAVAVTPSNGFNSQVSFQVTGLPTGASATFNPSTVTGSGTTTMTVTTSTSTPTGAYLLTIAGAGGGLTQYASATLTVSGQADFTVSVGSASVAAGSSAGYTVTVTPSNGFTGTVSFQVSGLPSLAGAGFVPTTVAPGGWQTTMTVSTQSCTTLGTATPTLTATSGSLSHNYAFSLTVNNPGSGAPVICGISSGSAGLPVTISGVNFGSTGTVRFGSEQAAVNTWSATAISVQVPSDLGSGTVEVEVSSGGYTSPDTPFTPAPAGPSINGQSATPPGLSLTSGPPLVGFEIRGSDFGAAQACPYAPPNNTSQNGCVMITGSNIGTIPLTVINSSWTASTIQVQLPSSIPTPPTGQTYAGQIYVVSAAGVASNHVPFTVSPAFGCSF